LITSQPNKLYLGYEYSPVKRAPMDEPFLLNIRDLTTHALCLGMTGTGKTGLGVSVLEEVLLQGVPAIIIDPKGDITNLALSFPRLQPADFEPWVDPALAEQENMSIKQLATQTAQNWREGLAQSGIGLERLQQLHDRVDIRIYTPGSDAGIPVNVLNSLSPPPETTITWARHADVLRERISQTCSALLELIGIEADPLKSREHILLATIFESAWRAQQTLDIALLIRMIQSPPIARIGVFDVESFFPRADRFDLAMALNNLAASPSFATWQAGENIDIQNLTQPIRGVGGTNPIGKTRASIFYIAHLDEAERLFFITLLLTHLQTWMRAQTGTSILRCLLYFDEVFGYCPPFPRNPSTKAPLMSLLKQGRAAGLGVFLATQNPADLDYKGLSNIGTWLIGRLRTERDRDRALEGLEGAGVGFDRDEMEKPLATLPPRTFLAQNVASGARFFQTRWAMSFLRGPITRDQIANLSEAMGWKQKIHVLESAASYTTVKMTSGAMQTSEQQMNRGYGESAAIKPSAVDMMRAIQQRRQLATLTPLAEAPLPAPVFVRPSDVVSAPITISHMRPSLPPDVREVFMTLHSGQGQMNDVRVVYRPHLLASATARITDRASGVMYDERHTYLLTLDKVLRAPDYSRAQKLEHFDMSELSTDPLANASFTMMPAGVSAKWINQSERLLVEYIYRNVVASVWHNRALKMYGKSGESKQEFRQRCEDVARTRRDLELERLHRQYEQRIQLLQEKLAREERELTSDRKELDARKREEMLTNVESVFNFVVGRHKGTGRSVSYGAQKRRQTELAEMEVRESEDTIDDLKDALERLSEEYHIALNSVSDKWMEVLSDMHEVPLVPRKGDIFVDFIALTWVA
jgi:hypothetical protein